MMKTPTVNHSALVRQYPGYATASIAGADVVAMACAIGHAIPTPGSETLQHDLLGIRDEDERDELIEMSRALWPAATL